MTDSPLLNPPAEAEAEDPLAFTPVPTRRARHDGWTPDRQRRFIAALEATGVVSASARSVGKTLSSAYVLRKRPGAESFAGAWDAALDIARDRALDAVKHLMHHGRTVPRFYRGRFTRTVHRAENRLLMAALRAMDAQAGRLG